MRCVSFENFGSPPKVLQVIEREMPQPGPGQARVKMSMSAIHNHDLMIITGHYGYKPPLPHVPGTEAVGVVDALGEGVTELKLGQRVSGGGGETWAEYYLVDAKRAIPMPDSIADETACQLVSMPLSAAMLLHQMAVKPGDWIIQNAANGAVGKMLARFAAEQRVNVVGLVRRDAAVAELAGIGIANVVSTETQGWQERVRDLTKGANIVRGLESVGGRAADEMLGLMGEDAILTSFGALSGRPLQVSPDNLLFKQAQVRGFWLALVMRSADPAVVGPMIGDIVGKAARGELTLPVAEKFDLAQAAEACAASTVAGRDGKIVLTA